MEEKQLYNIKDVEIFASGTWNGDEYTNEDLDQIIDAFNETKSEIKPYLKLGHDNDQKLLQKDGLPAAGWLDNIKRVGNKLVADFIDIPEKVYQLIKNKAYKKVSSEIYWNLKHGEKTYKRLLSGVALLGSNLPAVSSLSDILNLYAIEDSNYDNIKVYTFNQGDDMSEEIQEKIELELKEYKDKLQSLEIENNELKIYKEEHEKRLLEIEAEKKDIELKSFISDLEKQDLCTPAMKEYVIELLKEEKKEYTVNEKQYNKYELLQETLKLFKAASEVNFDENSEDGKIESVKNDEQVLDEKINKYILEHKVTYGDAYRQVMAEENLKLQINED